MGTFWMCFRALWNHFGVTLGSLWPYRRRLACVMRIFSPCVRPKQVQKQEIHMHPQFFDTFTNRGCSQESPRSAEPEGFTVILGSF